MISINTNISSLVAQKNMNSAVKRLNTAIERMTTGCKVNSAKDNPAAFAIISGMNTKMSSLRVAEDNTLQGLDLIGLMTDVLDEINDMVNRLRDLQIQAINNTYSETSLSAINLEANSLVDSIYNSYYGTKYNDISLFLDSKTDANGNTIVTQETNADEYTTFEQLGIGDSSFDVYSIDGTKIATYDVEASNTIGDFLLTLKTEGFTAKIINGEIIISSDDDKYIAGALATQLSISLQSANYVISTSQKFDNEVLVTVKGTETVTIPVTTVTSSTQTVEGFITTTSSTTQTVTDWVTTTSTTTQSREEFVTTTSSTTQTFTDFITTTSSTTQTVTELITTTVDTTTTRTDQTTTVTATETVIIEYTTTITSDTQTDTIWTTTTTSETNTYDTIVTETVEVISTVPAITTTYVAATKELKISEESEFLANPTTYTEAEVAAMTRVKDVSSFTSGQTYAIYTTEELLKFSSIIASASSSIDITVVLGADIDLASVDNCTQIGKSAQDMVMFSGTFDGNGHVISNITMNYSTSNYTVSFLTAGKRIANLGLENVNISGKDYVSAFSAKEIYNCYVTGSVAGKFYVGGIMAWPTSTSSISYCYVEGSVTGDEYVGGIAGIIDTMSTNCFSNNYFSGTVRGDGYAGGLIGCNSASNISNSYSSGTVLGSSGLNQSSDWDGTEFKPEGFMETTATLDSALGDMGIVYADIYLTDGTKLAYNFTSYNTINDVLNQINNSGKDLNATFTNGSFTITGNNVGIDTTTGDDNLFKIINTSTSTILTTVTATETDELIGQRGFLTDLTNANDYQTGEQVASMTRVQDISSFTSLGTYAIYTTEELVKFADLVNNAGSSVSLVYIYLGADIDLSSIPNWTPISNDYLSVQLHGNGHVISNLTINNPTADNQGLFGILYGAIYNLGLEDVNIIGQNYVGGFAGGDYSFSSFENCYMTGSVTGNKYVGGIAGQTTDSTIIYSYAEGLVTGTSYVGGLLGGGVTHTSIDDSYFNGTISASSSYGGVAGLLSNPSWCSNSYSTGNVIIASGGISSSSDWDGTEFKPEYFVDCIASKGSSLANYVSSTAYIYFSDGTRLDYEFTSANTFEDVMSQINNSGKGMYATFENGKLIVTESGVRIDTTTGADNLFKLMGASDASEVKTYIQTSKKLSFEEETDFIANPKTYSDSQVASMTRVQDVDTFESGKKYAIYTLAEMQKLATLVNNGVNTTDVEFVLGADIDFSSLSSWTPIGCDTYYCFKGTFDGNGHVLNFPNSYKGLGSEYIGVFGCTDYAELKNIGIDGLRLQEDDIRLCGALVAVAENTNITNCYVKNAYISASSSLSAEVVGGLVGIANYTNISNSYFDGTILCDVSPAYVGGLAGALSSGNIINSYANGVVHADNIAGGLVGELSGDTAVIQNAYFNGLVGFGTADDMELTYAGGLIGVAFGILDCSIKNSYAVGTVETAIESAALIGLVSGTDMITFENCFTNISGASAFVNQESSSYTFINCATTGTTGYSGVDGISASGLKNQSTLTSILKYNEENGWAVTSGNYPTLVKEPALIPADSSQALSGYGVSSTSYVYLTDGSKYAFSSTNTIGDVITQINNSGKGLNASFIDGKFNITGINIGIDTTTGDDNLFKNIGLSSITHVGPDASTREEIGYVTNSIESTVTETIWITTTSSTTETETIWTTTTTSSTRTEPVNITSTIDVTVTIPVQVEEVTENLIEQTIWTTTTSESTRTEVLYETTTTLTTVTDTIYVTSTTMGTRTETTYITTTAPGTVTETIWTTTTSETTSIKTITTTSTLALSTSTTFGELGLTNSLRVPVVTGKTASSFTINSDTTLSDFYLMLQAQGLTVSEAAGITTITGNGNYYLDSNRLMGLLEMSSVSKVLGTTYVNTESNRLTYEKIMQGVYAPGRISLKVGTGADEHSQIVFDATLKLDGLNDLRDIGADTTKDLLTQIDALSQQINMRQIEVGSMENRLMSVIEEIAVQYDNLANSRSTLRDADISRESFEYVQQQILQQASATLLSTANQSPSIALQLI